MSVTMPTDIAAWSCKTALPSRLCDNATAANATMDIYTIGASTPAAFAIDDLLGRFGRAVLPANTGADDDHSASGICLPVAFMDEVICAALDAGLSIGFCGRCAYPHATPGMSGTPSNAPFYNDYHNTTTSTTADKGVCRVRINPGSGALQTHIGEYVPGSGTGSTSATDHAIQDSALGMHDGTGVLVDWLFEFCPDDPAMAGAVATHNLRVTVRSYEADGVTVRFEAQQVAHYTPGSGATSVRTPTARIAGWSDRNPTFGRTHQTTVHAGMQGDIHGIFFFTRDASGGMLTLAESVELMDHLRSSAAIGGDLSGLVAEHAWTGEPDHTLEDVAVNGTLDLAEVGSGTAATVGSAAIDGLPDRFRGYIGATGAKGAATSNAIVTYASAQLAANRTLILLAAFTFASDPENATAHAIAELGTTGTQVILRVRINNTGRLLVSIREGTTTIVDLDCGDAGDLGIVVGATAILGAQLVPSASYHDGETSPHDLIVDVLTETGFTRSQKYPDGSPAGAALVTTSATGLFSLGTTNTGTVPMGGAVVAMLTSSAGSAILERHEMLREMEGWWESSGNGLERWTGGGAARNRSRSRARASAF